MTPKPDEHVIAHKRSQAGRVTVHASREYRRREDDFRPMTDCGRTVVQNYSWFWLEFRTLNPDLAVLCKRCWGDT